MPDIVVLGIDAAWTLKAPSGIALIAGSPGVMGLVAVEGSYAEFSGGDANTGPAHQPDVGLMLQACRDRVGRSPNLIAIDMPLATHPITGRRASDNAVSSAYGAYRCGTHSPSAERPGSISDRLRLDFSQDGFGLATSTPFERCLIEVYPHPALVELLGASERLKYKVGKLRAYWPGAEPSVRRRQMVEVWARIVDALEANVTGVAAMMPLPSSDAPGRDLKRYEDMLDAVVCAWVGVMALQGRCTPYGNEESAIWIPTRRQPEN